MLEISKRQIQTEYEMFDIAIHARLPHSLSGVGAISQIIITSTHNPKWSQEFLEEILIAGHCLILVIFDHLAVSVGNKQAFIIF